MAGVNLVNLERVRLAFGTRVLLDDVSLGIAAGERIGVVGRNGGGKSTLLRVLAGRQDADDGRVTHTGGLRVAVLGQDDELDPASTVRSAVVGERADHEWAGDARIRDVVTGLLGGLDAAGVGGLDAVVGPLSGGERRRIALARHLVDDPDLLLLDEPTNHLDVEGVDWLARHLAGRRPSSAFVAITHDRWFLDAVATATWEVHDGAVDAYDGGYAAYVLARAERARLASATEERRQNLLRKELAWLRRGPPARTSKPRFRIDAANALIADVPPPRDDVELVRFATTRLGKDVIDVEGITVRLGDRTLLDDVTWLLGPGDRVGLVGVNGSGKSTLLRVLSGEVVPSSGRVKRG
ncbi:MAG TPA: ATP-binding cassette domain-containing protein, partial [Angustibacter sp.]|nr:ATP-binding cassette domain-containing protein [Angustibacter sp.]